MEWNALYQPMTPPAGYESYYDPKNIFPGLQAPYDFKSWADFKFKVHSGWRLYMLQYRSDPEMEQFMASIKSREQDEVDEMIKGAFSYGKDVMRRGRDNVEILGKHAKEGAVDAKPYLQDRVVVLKNSVEEFAAGFKETMSGEKNIWGAKPPVETGEAVIIYRVKEDKAPAAGEDEDVRRR